MKIKENNQDSVLVAVYGSLRQGLGNHPLLGDSPLVSTERVKGFTMHSLGGFPCVYPGDGVITVEVYSVTQELLEGPLDSLEGHPSWYKREIVKTSVGDAWVYVMQPYTYKNTPIVSDGDWYKHRTGEL